MVFKYFHLWPWQTEKEYADAMCQCHVFHVLSGHGYIPVKYIKGHMDVFSLHANLLLPKQLGFWPTLQHCSSQAYRKRAGHRPDDCFGKAGCISWESCRVFPVISSSKGLLLSSSWHDQGNKLSCLIIAFYIPDSPVKEWEHAWIQDTWV